MDIEVLFQICHSLYENSNLIKHLKQRTRSTGHA